MKHIGATELTPSKVGPVDYILRPIHTSQGPNRNDRA